MLLEMKQHCEGEHQNDLGMYMIIYFNCTLLGTKVHHFETSAEFTQWKDGMEEKDHVYYTKQKEYKLSEGITHASQIPS